MSIPLKQATAYTWKAGPFLDDTDGKTAETGLTIAQADIRLSKNGGDYAQTHNTTGATHDEFGEYDVPLDTTDTGTLGTLKAKIHVAGALPVWQEFVILPANVYDSIFGNSLFNSMRTGTAQAGADGSITLDASASGSDDFYKNALAVIIGGTGIGQCRTISAYTGSSKVANITPNWVTNPSTDSVFVILPMGAIAGATAPTAGEVADAVWDEALSGHVTAGTTGKASSDILSAVDTEIASILAVVDTEVAAIKAKTDNLPASPAAVGSAMTLSAGSITAAVIATDAIDADAIKADAVTEIQSGLATAAALSTVAGYVDTEVAAILAAVDTEVAAIKAKTDNLPASPAATGDIPTAAANADAVLDELLSGHTGAGSLGKAVADALADTNELQTEMADGGRTDLLIDGIKAKTDNLPSDPADQSAVEAAITAAHSTTNGKIDAVDGYVDTEVAAIKAVTDKLDTALELDGAIYRLTANALEQAPSGTGTGDWTSSEKEQIRSALGVDGTKTAATGGQLQTLDGVADAVKAVTDKLDTALELDSTVYRFTVNALENSPTGSGGFTSDDRTHLESILAAVDTEIASILAVVDTEVAAIKAKTDNLPTAPADDTSIDSQLATIAGYLDTEITAILAAVDTEIAAIKAKTDLIPASPAAVGSAMTLTAAYDAAKTAASQASVNTIDDFLDTEIAAILADTNELQTDLVNGGRLDLLIDGIKAKTDLIPASPAAVGSTMTLTAAYDAAKTAASPTEVNAQADQALADYDAPTKTELDSAVSLLATAANLAVVDGIVDDIKAAVVAYLDASISSRLATAGYTAPDNASIIAIKAKTDNLPTDPADQSAVEAAITAAHSTTNGKIDAVDDYVDTEVAAIKSVTDDLAGMLEVDGVVKRFTANALELGPISEGGAGVADWTVDEKEQIRDALGITGDKTPATGGQLQALTGYVDTEVAAILADTNELQTDLVNGGRLDLLIDGIKAKTDLIPASPAAVGSAMTLTAAYDAAKTAASQASVNTIDDFLDTEIAAILADTNELQRDLVDGGRLDLLIDAIKAKVDSYLDAAISSRAPASTALSTVQWTNIRAGLLDHLDVAISSRLDAAGYTAPANSDVAAIKAKTDQLVFTNGKVDANSEAQVDEVALAAIIAAAISEGIGPDIDAALSTTHGSGPWGPEVGLVAKTYTLLNESGNPVQGVECWVTTDAAGLNQVDIHRITNDLGQVTFQLDLPVGTHVWIWHRLLTTGDEEVI